MRQIVSKMRQLKRGSIMHGILEHHINLETTSLDHDRDVGQGGSPYGKAVIIDKGFDNLRRNLGL